jgi:hypothetical protein
MDSTPGTWLAGGGRAEAGWTTHRPRARRNAISCLINDESGLRSRSSRILLLYVWRADGLADWDGKPGWWLPSISSFMYNGQMDERHARTIARRWHDCASSGSPTKTVQRSFVAPLPPCICLVAYQRPATRTIDLTQICTPSYP